MRILRIITSMDPTHGGPSQGIRNAVPELEKMGIANEIVCLDDPGAAFLGKDPFVIHAIGQAKGPWAYQENLTGWLLQNFHRFDVVIVHGLWQFHGYAARKALTRYKKINPDAAHPRLYVMPHGMLDPYFQQAAGRKLKALRNWIYWKLVERHLVEMADGLLFTTAEELELAKTTFAPYRPQRELNIGYGIKAPPPYQPAMESAFREKCREWANENYLLFLSRLHEKKGIDLLIDAYLRLKKAGLALPALVIAGPGLDAPFGQTIQQKASQDRQIMFAGMLTGDAKWGAFYHCEAFILPSHQENFGIAVAEALACARPVLTTYRVNIWREIKAGDAGLIENDTPGGIEQLLRQWSALTGDKRKEIAANAVSTFRQAFSVQQATATMAEKLKLNSTRTLV